jgi:hypothetical protein
MPQTGQHLGLCQIMLRRHPVYSKLGPDSM